MAHQSPRKVSGGWSRVNGRALTEPEKWVRLSSMDREPSPHSAMLKLRVLGCIELNGSDGQSIQSVLAQPKRLALLAYLTLTGGFCRKDTLLPLFCPDSDQEHARGALRQNVYLVRRSLGRGILVARGDDEIGIAHEQIWCDAVAFREALQRGDLEGALGQWSGELLPGFYLDGAPDFERWLTGERNRLRDEAVGAACVLAERADAAGDRAGAIHWTRFQLSLSPLDETAHRRLLLLLARSGDRAAALTAFEAFTRELERELGLEPSAETRELAESIRSCDRPECLGSTPESGPRRGSEKVGAEPSVTNGTVTPGAPVSLRWKRFSASMRWRLGVIASLILVLGAGISALVKAPSGVDRPILVVGTIQDLTGGSDPRLTRVTEKMLTTQLAQLSWLRLLSDARVERFQKAERESSELATLTAAARRAGATDLIDGAVYRLKNGRLRLDLQRIELASGTVHALPPTEGEDVTVLVRQAVTRFTAAFHNPDPRGVAASVAVLPFLDVSQNGRAQYLADGLSIELTNALGRIPGLAVASRAAAFSYRGASADPREIGRNLGVHYVLEGSVGKEGDSLRVSLQLVEAGTGKLRWSQPFAGRQSELFALQDQMEEATSQVVRRELGLEAPAAGSRRPANSEAYDAYLRGRFLLREKTPKRVRKAIQYFSKSVQRDPSYAPGYAGLGDAYVALAAFECPDSVLPRARSAINQALRLDDGLAGMHLANANILLHYDWEWAAAEREHRRALQLDPSLPEARFGYASFLRAARRPDEALRELEVALSLKEVSVPDTLAFAVVKHLKMEEFLYYARRYPAAREHARASLELDPGSVDARLLLALVHVQEENYRSALAEVEAIREEVGDRPSGIATIGYVYGRAGRRAKALEALNALRALSRERYVPRDEMALIHLGLGETDRALDLYEAAIADRHWSLVYLNADPRLDQLRRNPRFQRLLRRINAPT